MFKIIMQSGFYYTNPKRENPIKPFNHKIAKNDNNYYHKFSYDFPMIFLVWRMKYSTELLGYPMFEILSPVEPRPLVSP